MLDEIFFDNLKGQIQRYFEPTGGHEIEHTERVYRLSLTIAETEGGDSDILRASALLHDIARMKQEEMNNTICHATEGAKMSRELLAQTEFPQYKIDSVAYAIEAHRYSKGIKPTTLEAMILQDADRLEALGAVAISRIFAYNGKRNIKVHDPTIRPNEVYQDCANTTAINHFYEKILKIKPETFNTAKGREIAQERYEYIKGFLERFLKEWEGKE